jgi:predicted nucleic-acid-binding protein
MSNFKDILQSIISGDLKIVSSEVLNEMIENIGSTDPILRDKLIYSAFWTLVTGDHLSEEQLEYIINTLLENNLLKLDLNTAMSDSVFTRSFTTLFYAAILEYDSTKQIISKDLVRKVIDATHEYMGKESDLRGYVEKKGWAHAAAHGADLLDSIIKHPNATEDDAVKILHHIERFLTIAHGYQDDEEERLARAFVTLTKYHLSEDFIVSWLKQVELSLADNRAASNGELQPYYAQLAFKNFLKSSYFLLEKEAIQNRVKETIKRLVVQMIY